MIGTKLFKSEYKNKLVKNFVTIMLSNLIAQIQMFIDRIVSDLI